MADYTKDRANAYKEIKAAGQEMTLKRSVGGEYDPVTCKAAPATVIESPTYGLTEEYDRVDGGTGLNAGTMVLAGDKKITLGIPSADFPEPSASDILDVGSTAYRIIRCKPLAPGGVAIMYEVQARK